MKIQYKEKIVAFVDVLGFSEIVNNSDNDKIEAYYSYLESHFKKHLDKTNLQYLFISDSIVISADESKENLLELTSLLTKIQCNLLLKQIVVRGAISIGDLYINKDRNIIVGNGLIKAYLLERQAVNPRIILDRQLIAKYFTGSEDFLSTFIGTTKGGYVRSYVKIDSDHYPYINYLHYLIEQHPTYVHGGIEKTLELFRTYYYDNLYFNKYNWLLKKLIAELELLVSFENDLLSKNILQPHTLEKIELTKTWLQQLKTL